MTFLQVTATLWKGTGTGGSIIYQNMYSYNVTLLQLDSSSVARRWKALLLLCCPFRLWQLGNVSSNSQSHKGNEAAEHRVLVALSPQGRRWGNHLKQSWMGHFFGTGKKQSTNLNQYAYENSLCSLCFCTSCLWILGDIGGYFCCA